MVVNKNQTHLKTHGEVSSVVHVGLGAVGVVGPFLIGESRSAFASRGMLDGTTYMIG